MAIEQIIANANVSAQEAETAREVSEVLAQVGACHLVMMAVEQD